MVAKPKKVAYVVDDTGSMANEIAAVKNTIVEQINEFKAEPRFVKYALVTYKDSVNFRGSTIDHDEIKGWVNALSATGGGDCPEEGYGALDVAADKAAGSDIWWMTDADSHGGWLRLAQTRSKLLLSGCSLNSMILGACAETSATMSSTFLSTDGQQQSVSLQGTERASYASLSETILSADSDSDINAYIAGEELALKPPAYFSKSLLEQSTRRLRLCSRRSNRMHLLNA